jgi:hypothetical protein
MRKRRKKSQAALEYLTTYGWAFLVVLVAIGALIYFGIMNPARFAPNSCTTSTDFRCVDYVLKAGAIGAVKIKIANAMSKPVQFDSFSCIFEDGTTIAGTTSDGPEWGPNKNFEFTCSGSNPLEAGEKGKVKIEIKYKKTADGYIHTSKGTIIANVQAGSFAMGG